MKLPIKLGALFESDYCEGPSHRARQYTDEHEVQGWASCHCLSRDDIDHLLRGGTIGIDDGEYSHYIRLTRGSESKRNHG
jgi:hypothetical protein